MFLAIVSVSSLNRRFSDCAPQHLGVLQGVCRGSIVVAAVAALPHLHPLLVQLVLWRGPRTAEPKSQDQRMKLSTVFFF